jgi:sucrose-6-phosphate hydrolase SacC (GH32 family)
MSIYQTNLNSRARLGCPVTRIMRCAIFAAAACCLGVSHADTPGMVGRWGFDQTNSPYIESTGNASDFLLDASTTPATNNVGVIGNAAGARWNAVPGTTTRLMVTHAAVDRDSFGFSVWIRPVDVAPYRSLFGKEIAATVGGADYERISWQVQVNADDGSGNAPLEFVMRGASNHGWFGNVVSSEKIPLSSDSASWVHVAGGYDSATGELRLFVNGDETTASGTPGADNSDGGALAIGAMKNGPDYVQVAAIADYDDFRFYDAPLTYTDVMEILLDPELGPAGTPYVDGQVIAHWKLDETGAPYADWSGYGNDLDQDSETTTAAVESGVDGNALLLHWDASPGVSTRLHASGVALQSDSFGLSFWCRPDFMVVGDNILAKEMPLVAGDDFTRMAWQVKVGQDDGSGYAPIELVVRGSDRGEGDYFGNVNSSTKLPLAAASSSWIHVAGGYDALTGDLSIYIDGVAATAAGIPGANNSDGSGFSVGTTRNGTNFVAYAATVAIDDIQLYNRPLSQYAVAYLGCHPGEQFSFGITAYDFASDGSASLALESIPGWDYRVDAKTNLFDAFNPVLQMEATNDLSNVSLAPSMIDAAVGAGPHQSTFFRVCALLPDLFYGDLGFPPATITPFQNSNKYVPQFHYSWPDASLGDPCGLIRYKNKYHLFTWNHSTSSDLLHLGTRTWPFNFSIPNSGFWTGSTVMDKNNTSGLGTSQYPPMVTIFTIHNNSTGKEDIGIASSTTYGDHSFYNYSGNPVISTADTAFRDPDVFWDDQEGRWVLLVVRPAAQQIQFYYSYNLKNWTLMSTFGPDRGAAGEWWEVPGLSQVPIRGMGGKKKWVLHVGGGSPREKYWVGDFDGTTFTVDSATQAYLEDGTGMTGSLFASFEASSYAAIGWTTTGTAFSSEPLPSSSGHPGKGYLGDRLASSYAYGDSRTGTLASPSFTITKNCINFLIGGGNHPNQTCINLKVGGSVVRTTTGNNSDLQVWKGWNVAEYVGQQATIEIVDGYTGSWGQITIDHIMFSDSLFDTGRPHANWIEYGPDFYAPKFLRDFDGVEQDAMWMGWIGNWDYEGSRPTPSGWGKGAETLIRKLELVPTPRGYELTQQPINELQNLRGAEVQILPKLIADGTMNLNDFQPTKNTYELEVEFNLDGTADVFGLNLCSDGGSKKVVVGYDRSSAQLYLDRSSSDLVLPNSFANVTKASYVPQGDTLKLRIFVDQASIEVFTDDGRQVMTAQVYPNLGSKTIQLFSTGGATTLRSGRAWPIATIWPQ